MDVENVDTARLVVEDGYVDKLAGMLGTGANVHIDAPMLLLESDEWVLEVTADEDRLEITKHQ